MSNYSDDPSMVRVDFFKPSGKWYATEAMKFISYTGDIHHAFRNSLLARFGALYKGMTAVCLEPHHENAHPITTTEW